MGKLVIPSIVANGGSGGGSTAWGSITGTLSNQTDLQDVLDSKIGIVDGELKVSNGDNIVVEIENDSKTEIFSDSMSITADGQDSLEATISLNGVNGSILSLTDGSNSIDLKTNSTDGATITKTENNITENVLWNKAIGTSSISPLIATSSNGSYNISNTGLNALRAIKLGYNATALGDNNVAIGGQIFCANTSAIAIGFGAKAYQAYSIAIGGSTSTSTSLDYNPPDTYCSMAKAGYAIQLGVGTNNNAKTLQVYDYTLLDGYTGLIPSERVRTTITDTTSTSATISSVAGRTYYIFTQPLTDLTLTAIDNSADESVIKFDTDANFTGITFPASTKYIGTLPTWAGGKSYIISICYGVVVASEIKTM